MKLHRGLLIAGLLAAGTALAGGNSGSSNLLFVFDGAIGMQPLRAGGTANIVAGVNPAGVPWGMTSFQAVVKSTGEIRAKGTGVLLLGTDNIGTRGGPRQVILSLFCRNAPVAPAILGTVQTTPFNSQPVDLDEDGDFSVRGWLQDANGGTPPSTCGDSVDNRPVILVRSVTAGVGGAAATPGGWFAAGVISPRRFGHGRDWSW
jgi:hypothetical protein